jgi:hypothetical protein
VERVGNLRLGEVGVIDLASDNEWGSPPVTEGQTLMAQNKPATLRHGRNLQVLTIIALLGSEATNVISPLMAVFWTSSSTLSALPKFSIVSIMLMPPNTVSSGASWNSRETSSGTIWTKPNFVTEEPIVTFFTGFWLRSL